MGDKIMVGSDGLPWDQKEANMKTTVAAAGVQQGDKIRVTWKRGGEDDYIFDGVARDTGSLNLKTPDGEETSAGREDEVEAIEKL